ncbi:MAG: molecular chaperone DnaJ [Candidatus Heimdallarchaeota archaeon]|nr:molecular chaperone DnaJ [Candidatus Heimdallarchaeota archaeon]MDH5645077.1 molecular chaperone DnaJ [Candidatus Heimdallarchaeota archaeon]
MANKRDYYEVLEVGKNASADDLKRAYRKKAMKLHPDKYKGPKEEAEEKFKELNEAYSILSDADKRQMYDKFGHEGVDGRAAGGSDINDIFRQMFDFDLGDFFGGGFTSGRQRRRDSGPTKGQDVVLDLELTYEEAYEGISKNVKLPFQKACSSCKGDGSEPGSGMKTCSSCNGNGMTEKQVRQGFFIQISREPCRECRGTGQIPRNKCKSCKGSGNSNIREKITVRIPQGINEGEAVRVQGKGRPSRSGGLPGDLIFRIHLKQHPTFERNQFDVYMKLFVDYPTLVLGGKVIVPVIGVKDENPTDTLTIPSSTNLNDILTIKNKGFVREVRGETIIGDMHYVIALKIPKNLNKKQKELLKELQVSFQD